MANLESFLGRVDILFIWLLQIERDLNGSMIKSFIYNRMIESQHIWINTIKLMATQIIENNFRYGPKRNTIEVH